MVSGCRCFIALIQLVLIIGSDYDSAFNSESNDRFSNQNECNFIRTVPYSTHIQQDDPVKPRGNPISISNVSPTTAADDVGANRVY